ncbi:MAG: glycosyltransferase family 2 protein [Acidobacteriaceae bacterium]
MKFSVLIPTRNRLDLLSFAIETVRRQDYDDWEVIVSDNQSEEDVGAYIASLGDPRISYFRTDRFVAVTDNWNNALAKSNGDYVIMLGDDDCLMKGYFSTLSRIIRDYDAPDLIYTSAYLYAYPGVMPGSPEGFLQCYNYKALFNMSRNPFFLDRRSAMELVRNSLNFRMRFDYNMQFSLVSRRLIRSLGQYGPFYQSPYPDYYASNAMMLKAERILIVPKPLVTIGISSKSFGFFYFNDREQTGNAFLNHAQNSCVAHQLERVILPGVEMNTSWLLAMEALRTTFTHELDIAVNYRRYRFLQICATYTRLLARMPGAETAVRDLRLKMSLSERIAFDVPLSFVAFLFLFVPSHYRARLAGSLMFVVTASHARFTSPKLIGQCKTILDVFERMDPAKEFSEQPGLIR